MTDLTLAPDRPLARMRIVVDDAAGGDLTRTGPDGIPRPVRAGTGLSGDHLVDDYECPFGVPVLYTLDGAEAMGQLDVTEPWLTHPTDPTRSMPVVLRDDDEWEWEAPGTVHHPVDSVWPVVVWGPRTRHVGTLEVRTSWADRARVVRLLEDGAPLLLRVPPDCYADTGWVWPSTVRRSKNRPHDPTAVRWTLTYQRVDDPAGSITLDPSNSWASVPLDHPSWADLAASHPDWVDVALTPHPHQGSSP